MALLEAKSVSKIFGGLTAVDSLDFVLDEGQMCSIIGPNGAGKTTFFNMLTGIYKCEKGTIEFCGKVGTQTSGRSLVGLRPDQVSALGITRTFQNIRLFGSMTVMENILVGMHYRLKQTPTGTLFQLKSFKDEERAAYQRAAQLMHYVGLSEDGDELASNLPYGAQRRV